MNLSLPRLPFETFLPHRSRFGHRPGTSPRLPAPLALALAFLVAPHGMAAVAAQAPPAAEEAPPREEILTYDVTVEVEADGWLEVTEEIRVRALGERIRRGIYRDVPTSFPRERGVGRIEAPFEVVEVQRNGAPEPYALERIREPAGRGGVRVRIGEADRLLEPGEHTYAITYRTVRWIRHGEEEDHLAWNVTGNGWDFPIGVASARVVLPEAVAPGDVTLQGWTGPEGSTASELTATFDPGDGPTGAARFRTTGPLGPREGLTLAFSFPAEVVAAPSDAQRAAWFRLDWGPWIDAAVAVLLVLAVYLLLWNRVGRDPPGRPVLVRYEPPEDFSPAALGYVLERGHRNRHLAAAVVDLAVRGWVEIQRTGARWTLRRTGAEPGEEPPSEERVLLAGLFGGAGLDDPRGTVSLSGSPNRSVREAAKAFRADVERQLEKAYFRLNRRWFAAGLVVTALGFAALAWRVRHAVPLEGLFMGIWLTFWTMGTATLVWRVVQAWRVTLSGNPLHGFGAAFLTLFALPFVGAEVAVAVLLVQSTPLHLLVAAVVLGAVNVLFYHLLERPTLRGRGVLDEAEGFRRFLTSTEEDRIHRLQPADASLELFERYLPWAIALGVESAWAERFEEALATPAAAAPSGAATALGGAGLGWYSGGTAGSSLSGLTGSLGSSFSSSLSASSAAPSSSGSSGGGGGGSAGGGGGGGGGGGW